MAKRRFSDEEARQIKREARTQNANGKFPTYYELGARHGVSYVTICNVIRGRGSYGWAENSDE